MIQEPCQRVRRSRFRPLSGAGPRSSSAPSCRRAGTDTAQGARTLMDERQKHPAPTAEPTRGAAQRRFRAGASTALSLREKTSAANDGHPLEGMSAAGSNPVKRRRRCDRSFLRRRRFRDSYALAKGGQNRRAIRIGRRKRVRIVGGRRGFSAPAISAILFSRADNGPQEEPIASSFPSVMRGLKPNPFGRQRLRSTNFPFGCAEFLARQIRRPSPSSACAPALRVQAARAGLFCAAPRGTRWRWASGPRREKKDHRNGLQPLQVRPQA